LAAYQRNDFDKSLKLLRPLAEKGDARAQYLVGRQYQFGQAVKADRGEAFYWYKRAEAKGHQEAKLFRVLLEKRWKITAGERGRAERKIAADAAPKPAPQPSRVAQVESRPKPKPKPEKAVAETPRPREKPSPRVAERAKPEPTRPAVETARAKLPDPPKPEPTKVKTETAKAKAPDKPALVAARSTPGPEETTSTAPSVLPGKSETPRTPPRPTARDLDDDDDADKAPVARRYEAPPPETRTPVARRYDTPPAEARAPVAAAPVAPPPSDEGTFDAPGYKPTAPGYAPPSPYDGPAPYYAPAAPPTWRASIYYGPGAYYPRHWGYRPYAGYMHPGWRGAGWRRHRSRW
jgi:hypothetical protein